MITAGGCPWERGGFITVKHQTFSTLSEESLPSLARLSCPQTAASVRSVTAWGRDENYASNVF